MPVKQVVISILFFLSLTPANAQTARALLVAIDKYPEYSGWNEIHATNDIKIILPMLKRQGFLSGNIKTLTDQQASKKVIVKAIKQLASDTRPGDHIYIHFSCHGQQMADDNNDEGDKLDEALIPYDAPMRYSKGVYEGHNHLRDDELGLLLDDIRRKAGDKGSVVLTLDACHSGTGDRDHEDGIYVRGTTYLFAPPDFIAPPAAGSLLTDKPRTLPGAASLTVIAACMPDQLNYEYRAEPDGSYYGSLSYALCDVLINGIPMPFTAFRSALEQRITELRPPRGKIQTPLLQTSDEKKAFRIGL